MKRHLLHLVPFLIVAGIYAVQARSEGFTLVDAVAYGIGYGIVWFVLTFAAFGFTFWLFNRRNPTVFGGNNEPRQTRL
jgi:hypothetical protein